MSTASPEALGAGRGRRAHGFVVGAIGHRDPVPEDAAALACAVAEVLAAARQPGDTPGTVLTSLAAGADQLCAEVALAARWRLEVPLPCPIEEYRQDFADSDLERFDALVTRADHIYQAPDDGRSDPPSEPKAGRDLGYRRAGIDVVRRCDLLLVLWDGDPTLDAGRCGTAAMIAEAFALRDTRVRVGRGARPRIVQIATPRLSRPEAGAATRAGEITDLTGPRHDGIRAH